MTLKHSRVIENHVHPVHIDLGKVIIVLAGSQAKFLLILDAFCCVHQVPVTVSKGRPTHLHTIVYIRAVHIAASFGSDHDHTIGCTRTINGSRRGILEYGHALDISRIDRIEIGS